MVILKSMYQQQKSEGEILVPFPISLHLINQRKHNCLLIFARSNPVFQPFFCDAVSTVGGFFSANNWVRIMSKAVQIVSREGTVGTMFLRYQNETVDAEGPERSVC